MSDSIMSMEEQLFLGIDLGTTNIKALLVDRSGKSVSEGSAAAKIHFSPGGAVEQDIEQIWQATLDAMAEAVRKAGGGSRRIAGIGVSSQGGAIQVMDAAGNPSGPTIGWQDSRGGPWDKAITERLGRDWFIRRTGFARSAGAIGQVLRLREQGAMAKGSLLGFAGDIVVGRLCGTRAHDATSLSEPCLLNPTMGGADPEVLDLLGLDPQRLPVLLPADRSAGGLLPEVASRIGAPSGIPVGPAVHDQYAAAIGCNVVRAGDTMLGLGTAWVILAISAAIAPPVAGAALVGRHPVAGLFGQMLSMVNGGSSVTWAARTLNLGDVDIAGIDRLASSVPSGSSGVSFRPLLLSAWAGGLPPGSAGRLDGLRLEHSPAHIVRAVIEGLACELGRYLRVMKEGGVEAARLVVCGKAASSAVTPQIIADTVGLDVECARLAETSSLGAAILARKLAEPDADLAALSDAMKPSMRSVKPGAGASESAQRLDRYIRGFSKGSP
jgi:xylulokinase